MLCTLPRVGKDHLFARPLPEAGVRVVSADWVRVLVASCPYDGQEPPASRAEQGAGIECSAARTGTAVAVAARRAAAKQNDILGVMLMQRTSRPIGSHFRVTVWLQKTSSTAPVKP